VTSAAGGWESWSWDASLFAGAAAYYEQGRLPYALGLADVFARSLELDGQCEDEVFRQAGFLAAESVVVPDQRVVERTADDVVAMVFSPSSTAPHLFGDRLADYESAVRAILAEASPAGRFSVRLPDNILRIWRLPALGASRTRSA